MEIDMKTECTSYLYMMDTDWVVHIEYEKTSDGYEGDFYDPGWDPEYEIYRIWLARDINWKIQEPRWEQTGKQYHLLCDMEEIHDAVRGDIAKDERFSWDDK
jgi:hypothetical protein